MKKNRSALPQGTSKSFKTFSSQLNPPSGKGKGERNTKNSNLKKIGCGSHVIRLDAILLKSGTRQVSSFSCQISQQIFADER